MVDVLQPVTARKSNAVDYNMALAVGHARYVIFCPVHFISAALSTNQVKLVKVNVWYLGSLVKRHAHYDSITPIHESQRTQTM